MNLGEIKLEALKLMGVDFVVDYAVSDLADLYSDEAYRDYLVAMPGAVNRCFSNLEARGALPSVSRELSYDEGVVRFGRIRYDLPTLIPDCQRLERIVREDSDGGYDGRCEYMREGGVLVLPEPRRKNGELVEGYTVVYKPRVPRVDENSDDYAELNLPEHIAALVPYYVKGDLYRKDEPEEAAEARNYYESALEQLLIEEEGAQAKVKSVYSEEAV